MATSDSTATPQTEQRPEFQPLLTKEQVFEAEANHDETWGVARRLTLLTLTRTSEELIEDSKSLLTTDNGDHFFKLLEQIAEYRAYLKAGIESANCAEARLMSTAQYLIEKMEVTHA